MIARRLRRIALLAIGGLLSACGDPADAGEALAVAHDPTNTVVVEIREGYSDDRWLYSVDVSMASSTTHPNELNRIREARADQVIAFDEHREACRQLGHRYVELLGDSAAGRELDDKGQSVIPAPDLSRAVVLSPAGFYVRVSDDAGASADSIGALLEDGYRDVAWCSDGRRLAMQTCGSVGHVETVGLMVANVSTGAIIDERHLGRSFQAVSWSPGCDRVAVLVSREHLGSGPLESLGRAMGHGVPYVTFSLLVIDLAQHSSFEIPVAEEVKYGEAELMWDSGAVEAYSR